MSKINHKLSDQLLDWYWEHGSKREGAHVLTRGNWLDKIIRVMDEARNVEDAQTIYTKPTMALWGPSQTGKSTLLAQFIDHNVTEEGYNSPLSWHDTCPARFCGRRIADSNLAVLNPFHAGSDASGCVTRFQLKESVRFPEYPVEVQFASIQEVFLYMAVGYLSETVAKRYANAKAEKEDAGEVVILSAGDLTEAAARHTKKVKDPTPDKEAYMLLTALLNVVDILIEMDTSRFNNLRQEWPARRSELLNNDKLVSSVEVVEAFAAEILWDNWSNLTSLFQGLSKKCRELGGKTVYCTIEIAAELLDIDAARSYSDSDNTRVKRLIDSCKLREVDENTVILNTKEGNPFFNGGIDFGLAQGLVSLIIVPLRKDIMSQTHPAVYEMLEKADLLDFPGVSNEHTGALLHNEQLALDYVDTAPDAKYKYPLHALISVLKRGKTAAIVIGSSRKLNIDAFSLLVRMPAGAIFPGHPMQLQNGIRFWFSSMGLRLGKQQDGNKLPINLLLTFSATLLNLVHKNGTGDAGLKDVFNKLKKLEDLSSPDVVTTYCVNYPQFPDGHIQIDTDDRKRQVIGEILGDKHFKAQFSGTEQALEAMADLEEGQYGGRIFFFNSITRQLSTDRRQALLVKKQEQLEAIWDSCLREALPPKTADDNARAKDLNKLIEALQNPPTSENKLMEIARTVQDFQNIDPAKLDTLPNRSTDTHEYIAKVIKTWLENSKAKNLQTSMGFESEEHRNRVLTYLYARLNALHDELDTWMKSLYAVRSITNMEERREGRRLIATRMGNALFPMRPQHRKEQDSINLLNRITQDGQGTGKNHPYYISVIEPFCDVLDVLTKSEEEMQRGYQAGDKELETMVGDTTEHHQESAATTEAQ